MMAFVIYACYTYVYVHVYMYMYMHTHMYIKCLSKRVEFLLIYLEKIKKKGQESIYQLLRSVWKTG